MKRFVLILSFVFAVLTWSFASKGIPTPLVYTQPDGSTITVTLWGDEHGAWFTTTDGIFLCRDNNAFYVAQVAEKGLAHNFVLAHDASMRSQQELNAIAMQDKQAIANMLENANRSTKRKASIGNSTPKYVAHNGSPRILVVLAEYSDMPFTLADPNKSFDQMFNGEGTPTNLGNAENKNFCSIREYFKLVSNGNYTPTFDVVGPVKVGNMSTYGGTSDNANDENPTKLVSDAVNAALSQISLADYDNDEDGAADIVYVVYSGYGQNTGGANNTVWAKTGSCGYTFDGKKISWYTMASELNLYPEYYTNKGTTPEINGIGVFCHEFSHAMGLPDTYPTSASAIADNQEMEYWDLMDGGEYVGNGYTPKDYTAWEREVMGWMTIETLTTNQNNITVSPLLDGGKAYKFTNPLNTNEYFVLENIQKTGLNKNMPGHGLIVYHVNTPATIGMGSCPNNIKGQPGMAIVPGDGACLSSYLDHSDYRDSHYGDPFPGTTRSGEALNHNTLNHTLSLPNYKWYSGEEKVDNALIEITEDNANHTVTFGYVADYDAYVGSATIIMPSQKDNCHLNYIYNINGQRVNAPKHGIYIQNGRKIVR